MGRGTMLSPPERFLIEQWGRQLDEAFSVRPYLVGSVLTGGAYRDVDVRMLDPWPLGANARRAINLSVSLWGRQVTGLPIDFQFQAEAEFHAEDDKPRSVLGIMPEVWLTSAAEPQERSDPKPRRMQAQGQGWYHGVEHQWVGQCATLPVEAISRTGAGQLAHQRPETDL